MTGQERAVLLFLVLGFAVSTVGVCVALGAGWGSLWAGLLLMAGALKLDAG